MTAFAGFLTGARGGQGHGAARPAAPCCSPAPPPSLRGGRGFSAFAGGKHAVRALAQSMARELGPQNIHVAHVVIDGAIDTEWIKANFPERYNAGPDAHPQSRRTSPRPTGSSTASSAAPGPSRWISGRGRRPGAARNSAAAAAVRSSRPHRKAAAMTRRHHRHDAALGPDQGHQVRHVHRASRRRAAPFPPDDDPERQRRARRRAVVLHVAFRASRWPISRSIPR